MKARVVVTRDEPPGGPLASALERHGLAPVLCPAVAEAGPLDPAPLEDAAQALERYDWLIVASRRAVLALFEARSGRRLPASVRTAAVGPSTAEALAAFGASNTVVAPEAGARSLAATLASESWTGKRVLLPRAEGGSTELAEALKAAGANVEEVVAYRTLSREPGEILAAWPSPDPDAAIVASPSAARALIAGLGVERLAGLAALIAIGPTTAAAIAAAGLVASLPHEATFEAAAALAAELLEAGETDPAKPARATAAAVATSTPVPVSPPTPAPTRKGESR